jgi:hypothetical protein
VKINKFNKNHITIKDIINSYILKMNLFFGGSLGSLMRPHFFKRVSPFGLIRNQFRQNVLCNSFLYFILLLGSAARATALSHELVQRNMGQFNVHNHEEADGIYTRPTLDLYIVNNYWNYLTSGLSKEEVTDFEKARAALQAYEKLYSLMEYTSDINDALTAMETRIAGSNPSIPLTVYRKVTLK